MEALIVNHVKGGGCSVVHHDGWGGYSKVRWDKYAIDHVRHVHGDEGSEVRDFVQSNHIEGLWGTMKRNIKRIYVSLPGGEYLTDFIFEAGFRHMMKLTIQRGEMTKQEFLVNFYASMLA